MDVPQDGPSELIPENSSYLHLEERCNRLLRTLAQCRPRFRVSCTLCNNMTPSDHRTTHLVHFLRHHTTETDDKDQLFAFVGISDSDTYNRSWQQGRNKIAKRKASIEKNNQLKNLIHVKKSNEANCQVSETMAQQLQPRCIQSPSPDDDPSQSTGPDESVQI